jgi:hypothetical protein
MILVAGLALALASSSGGASRRAHVVIAEKGWVQVGGNRWGDLWYGATSYAWSWGQCAQPSLRCVFSGDVGTRRV